MSLIYKDSMHDYEPRGRRFESFLARQLNQGLAAMQALFLFPLYQMNYQNAYSFSRPVHLRHRLHRCCQPQFFAQQFLAWISCALAARMLAITLIRKRAYTKPRRETLRGMIGVDWFECHLQTKCLGHLHDSVQAGVPFTG